jgi:hypothetical protein
MKKILFVGFILAIALGSCKITQNDKNHDLSYKIDVDAKAVVFDSIGYVHYVKEFTNEKEINDTLAKDLINFQNAKENKNNSLVSTLEEKIVKSVLGDTEWYRYKVIIDATISEKFTGSHYSLDKTIEKNWNDSIKISE